MDLPNCVSSTRGAYAPDAPIYADDAREYFESISDEDLEEIMFQLALDLKSIEGQIFASRARFFMGEQQDSDKGWYAKTRSVQAIKITQLMCAEHEFDRRLKLTRNKLKKAVKEITTAERSHDFLNRFFTNARHYLKPETFNAIIVFSTGDELGQFTDVAHRSLLPNWSELRSQNTLDKL